MVAEIVDLVPGVELLARALREEDLAAAAGLADAGRAMHVQAEVRRVADGRLARVQPHPDAQLDARGPLVCGERRLRADDCVGGCLRVGEHDEELVAALVDDDAVAALDRLAEKPPVVVEHVRVAVAETLQELRRSFDVGEDESDGSMRKLRHARLLQRDLGTDAGSHAGRALHLELAAQRGDAVGEAAQPRAAQRVRPADAVVRHLDHRDPVHPRHRHLHR